MRPLKIFAASIYIFGQGSGGDICRVHTFVDRKLCSVKIQKKFSSSGQNEFLQRLPEKAACNEHCTIDFTVKVKDRTAPVHFFLNK